MSALFDSPVLIQVTAGTGSSVKFTATHRRIVTPRMTDYDNTKLSIAEHLARVSSTANGNPVGAVIFNAAGDSASTGLDELEFMVGTPEGMRYTEDGEITDDQLRHWAEEHRAWKKHNRTPRRRVLETAPPAPTPEETPVTQPAEPTPSWGEIPTVDEEREEQEPSMADYQAELAEELKDEIRASQDAAARTERLSYLKSVEAAHGPVVAPEKYGELTTQDGWDPEAVAKLKPAVVPMDEVLDAQRRGMEAWQEEHPAQPTRRQVRELESLMERGKHSQDAQDGWRGALNGLGLHLGPDTGESRRREMIQRIQRQWRGTKYATVLNEKGSAGKTPTVLMLAAALQEYGPGPVIVRDGNPSGNADERVELTAPAGVHEDGTVYTERDLAVAFAKLGEDQALDASTMGLFLHKHTTDKYALLKHYDTEGEFAQLDADEVDLVQRALEPHARAILTDTGNSPGERRDVPVLRRTDQLIVPMLTYADRENGARKSLEMLERRAEKDPLYAEQVANAVAVIHVAEPNRGHRREAEHLAERWSDVVRAAVVVPYDPHMASNSLRFRDLALPTRTAFIEVADLVTEGFRRA